MHESILTDRYVSNKDTVRKFDESKNQEVA